MLQMKQPAEAFSKDTPPPPRVVEPPHEAASRWERSVHAVLETVANAVVRKPRAERLRFGLVKTPEELAAVGRMRLKVYREKLPYLLKELAEDGTDGYDAHSFLFAVWRGEQVVASIRATRYPFETLRYVPEPELAGWLGRDWKSDAVEWGRLVADTPEGFRRLTPALLSYGGPYLGCLTSHRQCFGYTRHETQRVYRGFRGQQHPNPFHIPHRGEHAYVLVKTQFLKGTLLAAPRWLGSLAGGLLKKSNPSHP